MLDYNILLQKLNIYYTFFHKKYVLDFFLDFVDKLANTLVRVAHNYKV